MKNSPLFALFVFALLSVPQADAYSLNVKVTITQDTAAVGTNVSLVSDGIEMTTLKANLSGEARFNATSGSYFVLLRRYPYPLHVSLVEVQNDSSVLLTMRQLVSYSTAYGQITGPPDFTNATVAAYQGGLAQKRVVVNKHGLYVLSYLPEGTYDLVFSAPGFADYSAETFLPYSDSIQVNAALKKPEEVPLEKPVLISPAQVSQYSTIEVSLTVGDQPVSGAEVQATTPSGSVVLKTGKDGKARLNAAEGGTYRFTYGDASTATAVPMPQQPPAKPPAQPAPEQPYAPPTDQPEQQSLLLPALLLAGFGIIVVMVIAAAAFFTMRSKKTRSHKADARAGHGSSPIYQHEKHPQHEQKKHAKAVHRKKK